MSSFIFNDFRERYIRGEVPSTDVWYAYPVTSAFTDTFDNDDIKLNQFQNSRQMDLYINHKKNKSLSDTYSNMTINNITYRENKEENAETNATRKPAYITKKNWNDFLIKYPQIGDNRIWTWFFSGTKDCEFGNLGYTGFYWVTCKEELAWCANRVNGYEAGEYTDNYNNKIAIVLGDHIGPTAALITQKDGTIKDNRDVLNICIGKNPNRPFEGLLFGNGYEIRNIIVECTTDCNGLVGYLGKEGIINHVTITGRNKLKCSQKLNMTHIKNKGTDIETALLCGHSYGLISYCSVKCKLEIEDFIPAIYAVENKNEDIINPIGDNPVDNRYYPSYMCINSPGNIIPYIGYFNEGVIGTIKHYPADLTKCSIFDSKIFTNNSNGALPHTATTVIHEDARIMNINDRYWVITNGGTDKYNADSLFDSLQEARDFQHALYDFENKKGKTYVFDEVNDPFWLDRGKAHYSYTCPDKKPPLIVFEPTTKDYSETIKAFNGTSSPEMIDNPKISYSSYSATPREKEYYSYNGYDDTYSNGVFIGRQNQMIMYDYNTANYVAKQLLPTEDRADVVGASPSLWSRNFGFGSHHKEGENYDNSFYADRFSACPWIDVPTKLHQFSRAAYYVSPVAGWSKGSLNHNVVNVDMTFNNEFAGFAGGLIGKYAGGNADSNKIKLNVYDTDLRNDYVLSAESDKVDNMQQINFELDNYTNCDDDTKYKEDMYTDYYTTYKWEAFDFPYNKSHFQGTYIDIYDLPNFAFNQKSYIFSANGIKNLNNAMYNAYNKNTYSAAIPESEFAGNTRVTDVLLDNIDTVVHETYNDKVLMAANFEYLFKKEQAYDKTNDLNVIQSAHCCIPLVTKSYYDIANKGMHIEKKRDNVVCGSNEYTLDPETGWLKVTKCPKFYCDYVLQPYRCDRKRLNNTSYNFFNTATKIFVEYSRIKIGMYDKKNNWHVPTFTIDGSKKDNYLEFFSDDFPLSNTAAQGSKYSELQCFIVPDLSDYNDFTTKMCGNVLTCEAMYFERINDVAENVETTLNGINYIFNGQPLRLKAMKGVKIRACKKINYLNETLNGTSFSRNKEAPACGVMTVAELYIDWLDEAHIIQASEEKNMRFPENSYGCAQEEFNYKLKSDSNSYLQILKSIHNVGGFAGSLVYNTGNITNNKVLLNNNIGTEILISKDEGGNEYFDYSNTRTRSYTMLDRYGTLAAVCELNSNISDDHWDSESWPLMLTGNYFKYDEPVATRRNHWYLDISTSNNIAMKMGPMQIGQPENFGVASPLIAEVKPTYLSVPSIVSYNASWSGVDWDGEPDLKEELHKTKNLYGNAYYTLFTNDIPLKWDSYDPFVFTYNQNIDMPSKNAWLREHPSEIVDSEEKHTIKNWFDTDISKMIPKMFAWSANNVYVNNFGTIEGRVEDDDESSFSAISFNNTVPGYTITDNPVATITYPRSAEDIEYEYNVINQPQKLASPRWYWPGQYSCYLSNGRWGMTQQRSVNQLYGIYRTKKINITRSQDFEAFKYQKKSSLYPYFGSSLGVTSGHSFWYDCGYAGERMDENDIYAKNIPNKTWLGDFDTKLDHFIKGSVERSAQGDIFEYYYDMDNATYNGKPKQYRRMSLDVEFKQDGAGKIGYWAQDKEIGYSGEKFDYNGNVLHIGNEKSSRTIREEIRKNEVSYTSSVAADDFHGLYVTDSKGNNVMYIDTDVGAMNGYSIWTMPLREYVATDKTDTYKAGLIMEIK